MRIAITGATGFVGAELCAQLAADGARITVLTRNAERARQSLPMIEAAAEYDAEGRPPVETVDGADAVINLAGESVNGRWTASKRERIRDSRVTGTRRLVEAIEAAERRPKVLVSASAVGYYGDRGDEVLTETSAAGTGFLTDVSEAWELEALRAERLGVRVVVPHISVVLETGGGALGSMLLPAKLGLGGPLGSGKQWWSWIHRDDLIGLIRFALTHEDAQGPFNAAAPEPVRQKEFARTLGRVLNRPAFLPAPAFALKVLLGGFSVELLSSKRVLPEAAQAAGYEFRHPRLEPALRDILGR